MDKKDKAINKAITDCLNIIKEAAKNNSKNYKSRINFYKTTLVNLAGNGTFAIIKEDDGIALFLTESIQFLDDLGKWFSIAIDDLKENLDSKDDDSDEDEDNSCYCGKCE